MPTFPIKINGGLLVMGGPMVHGNALVEHITNAAAATYTVLASDRLVASTYSATGAVTITLVNPATVQPGYTVTIKDAGGAAATHNITINPHASETIDGGSSKVISSNYGVVTLYSDGTNWFTR